MEFCVFIVLNVWYIMIGLKFKLNNKIMYIVIFIKDFYIVDVKYFF